jgi:ribose-phosphate pyrophosphokinase
MPKETEMVPDEMPNIKIFSGKDSRTFSQNICGYLSIAMGKSYTIKFSDGNIFVKIMENVRGSNVFFVQSCSKNPNDDFMELLFMIDAFKRASANTVTAVIPYFSYAKGDKKDEPRVSIRARACADCLETTGVDRILTMDLHSPQIQGFFKKPVDHLYGIPTLCEFIKNENLGSLVAVSPDSGFAKNAHTYGKLLGVPVAIGYKIRTSHDEKAKVASITGDVKNKNALIVDDFTISCGTLADTARVLKENGAKEIFACVSHAVLKESGLKLLSDSDIKRLYITDTVENADVSKHPKIKIVSVAALFAKAISKIHHGESISELFEQV